MSRLAPAMPVALLTAVVLLLEAAPAHAASIVARDDEVATVQGRARILDVLANDQGDGLQVVRVGSADHGSVQVDDGGAVTYRARDGYLGEDSFSYWARDDGGDTSERATVHVTVTEPTTVDDPAKWTVLRPATVSGSGPAGAVLTVRVTGPRTDRALRTTVGQDGRWSTSLTPEWEGRHEVQVSVTEPDNGDEVRAAVTAKAHYLTATSGALSAAAVGRSYRAGCPVLPSSLRALSITYWDWDGRLRTGKVVAHARAVTDLRHVFRVAFRTRFPFRSVTPVDRYYRGGHSPAQSDLRSMKADNTSAYNCRKVTGNRHRRSPHSYGISIDINPRENPYVTSRKVYPKGARRFLDRSHLRKGMLVRSSPVVKAFTRRGWHWGAHWGHPDYQHFDM